MAWKDILKEDMRFCERCKSDTFSDRDIWKVKDTYGRDVKVCLQCAKELDEERNREYEKDGE